MQSMMCRRIPHTIPNYGAIPGVALFLQIGNEVIFYELKSMQNPSIYNRYFSKSKGGCLNLTDSAPSINKKKTKQHGFDGDSSF